MKKENSEFLDGIESILDSRPSHLLWLIPFIVGVLIVSIILWLIFSQVDVIAPSSGKVIPNSKMIFIQPKDIGIIDKIYVKNGDMVKKNQKLVDLKSEIELYENNGIITKKKNLLIEKLYLEAYLGFINNSNKLIKISSKEIPDEELRIVNLLFLNSSKSYKNELESLMIKTKKIKYERDIVKAEIRKKVKLLPYVKEKMKKAKSLSDEELESKAFFKDLEQEYIENVEDLRIKKIESKKLRAQLNISKKDINKFTNSTKEDLIKKLSDITKELKILTSEVNKNDHLLESKSIKASIDGVIYNLRDYTSGKVVQPAEVIMELIPKNNVLEVEAKVLNRDIGFIKIGQKVKVKLDSFKFTKYGFIEGIITNIEKASILDDKLGEIYPIIVKLETDKIKVDNNFIQIIPGMTCSVDIKIGKRRLIEYIISPMIRYKDEALKER